MVVLVVAEKFSVHLHCLLLLVTLCLLWRASTYHSILFRLSRLVFVPSLFLSDLRASELHTTSHFEVFRTRDHTGYDHTFQACTLLPTTQGEEPHECTVSHRH